MKNIRSLRKQVGITQKELAKILGYEQTIVSMWENGTREPNVQTLVELSNIFGCSIDELVGNETIQVGKEPEGKVKKLKETRERFGLTQYQLGQKLGFGQHAVSTWENGTREPDIKTLKMLSKFFGVSIDYLLDNEWQINDGQTYSEKQKELLPLIQLLNNEQCQRIYDYICGMLDISIEEQKNWRCNE